MDVEPCQYCGAEWERTITKTKRDSKWDSVTHEWGCRASTLRWVNQEDLQPTESRTMTCLYGEIERLRVLKPVTE